MGQLEKYGLYVLCLVIFLILGVTMWGIDDAHAGKGSPSAMRTAAGTSGTGGTGGTAAPSPATGDVLQNEIQSVSSALLGPGAQPVTRRESGAGTVDDIVGGNDKNKPVPPAGDDPKTPAKSEPQPALRATYVVQDGDTFDSIAKKKLGKASLRDELMRLNARIEPKKLRAGMELVLPDAASLAAKPTEAKKGLDKPLSPPADASRSYVVKKGDNYEQIAIAQLGDRKRAAELEQLNGVPATKLKPGMNLKLPKK